MGIFGRKAKEADQSAARHEKLDRKGREPADTGARGHDGTKNSHAEIARDKRHAAGMYREADKTTK